LIVNTRPIGIAGRGSDLEAGTPITPLHLLLGRASIEAPQIDFHNAFNLTRRLQFVEEVKREFWNKWKAIASVKSYISHSISSLYVRSNSPPAMLTQ
jgi:hypothetical protein